MIFYFLHDLCVVFFKNIICMSTLSVSFTLLTLLLLSLGISTCKMGLVPSPYGIFKNLIIYFIIFIGFYFLDFTCK